MHPIEPPRCARERRDLKQHERDDARRDDADRSLGGGCRAREKRSDGEPEHQHGNHPRSHRESHKIHAEPRDGVGNVVAAVERLVGTEGTRRAIALSEADHDGGCSCASERDPGRRVAPGGDAHALQPAFLEHGGDDEGDRHDEEQHGALASRLVRNGEGGQQHELPARAGRSRTRTMARTARRNVRRARLSVSSSDAYAVVGSSTVSAAAARAVTGRATRRARRNAGITASPTSAALSELRQGIGNPDIAGQRVDGCQDRRIHVPVPVVQIVHGRRRRRGQLLGRVVVDQLVGEQHGMLDQGADECCQREGDQRQGTDPDPLPVARRHHGVLSRGRVTDMATSRCLPGRPPALPAP